MTEPAKLLGVTAEQSEGDSMARVGEANKQTLDFMLGTQRVFLEELAFQANEMLDRTRTETHLFAEFISKLAGSHSVKDLGTMCKECSKHQLDFIRRDCERLFKHSERLIDTTSKLIDSRLRV
jgi:hypothetical protein